MATLGTLIQSAFDINGASNTQKSYVDNVVSPNNGAFNKSSEQYGKYINSNTGANGYNSGYNMAKPNASEMTRLQSNGAGAQALGNAVSAGGTRGRATDSAGQMAANTFSNNYANNVQNQQNVANQQLANQINSQGTLMGAQLTNDQAQYNQNMNNLKEGKKEATGPLGWITDAFSDEKMKDKVKIGLGDEDLRMTRYKRCGKKLKQMNPNKWNELKWEAK